MLARRLLLLSLLLPSVAWAQDTSAPTSPSISIASGAAYSATATVSLGLSATDDTGVTQMCISNATTCTSWVSYATTYSWNLGTSPQGTRTVYARFRDAAGNTSSQVSDTIVLDSVVPSNGTMTAALAGSGALALSWSGFSDATSGITSYTVAYRTGSSPASKCTSGTTTSTTTTSATISGLSDGTTYYLRVCAVDAAGNVSTGAITTAIPASETNPPTGTVTINSGADYTSSGSVTLTLAATDDTAVSQMCVSNSTACTVWQSYATTRAWSFSGTGTKTVYVYFKDSNANVSVAATDTIIVDTSAPTNGTLSATGTDSAVSLSWSGFSDTISGIASYKLVQSTGISPTSCSTGTTVYTGTDTSVTLTGLSNGTTYYYRVCATNNAGLSSTGATASAIPAAETNPPTNASISINAGADWTNTASVTLSLYAEDDSAVTAMCIANTTTCSSWEAYNTTRTWSLGGTGTTRTVYAWFKDVNGNITPASVSDTISLDSVKPTGGAVTGSSGTISIDVSWSGFTDDNSGIVSYIAVYTRAAVAPANCGLGNVGYAGAGTSATVTGLEDGETYTFRVCAIDAAGNVSDGATFTIDTVEDLSPPTGTVTINSDAAWTNTPGVLLNLAATDDLSGVGRACISESPDRCGRWESYTSLSSWTFDPVEGTQTIYVWYEDGAFNLMTSPVSDSIGLDMTPPVDGAVTGAFVDTSTATVAWSGYTDALSGVGGYVVAYNSDGSAPSACFTADYTVTTVATNTTLSEHVSHATPTTIRVCAYDLAGNYSSGATVTLDSCTPLTWYRDDDADGYGLASDSVSACDAPAGYIAAAGDCDDTDLDVHPGATEVCDDVDQDCDGSIDEDAIDPSVWYADSDADGFGDPLVPLYACDAPIGYLGDATDCNDTMSGVHPGATEVCDDVDQDCDGSIDEGAIDASAWYVDGDIDGYGAGAATVACDAPAGMTADNTDCVDNNTAINPGATEVCDDGIDNNCDGLGCQLNGDVALSSAPAVLVGEASDDYAGVAIDAVGDVNSDGYTDLLVGAHNQDGGGLNSGTVYVVTTPITGTYDLGFVSGKIIGEVASDFAGYSLAGAGDVNGDGDMDFFIGAWGSDHTASEAGSAYVVHGPVTGLRDLSYANARWDGQALNDRLGWNMDDVGDFTGDGVPDMIVGATGNDQGGGNAGAAYLVSGSATGSHAVSGAAAKFIGENGTDLAGFAVAGAGDIDGDGLGDVLVGAYQNSSTDAGAAYLILGPVSGNLDLSLADVKLIGATNGDYLGYSVAGVGDMDGDGAADVMVGAPGVDNGAALSVGATYLLSQSLLLSGPSSINMTAATASLKGVVASDFAGRQVEAAGDVDQNGYDDVLIGAVGDDTNGNLAGAAYLVLAPISGAASLSTADVKFLGNLAGDSAGISLAALGDLDPDGIPEFAVSAYADDTGGSQAGAVYIFSYSTY